MTDNSPTSSVIWVEIIKIDVRLYDLPKAIGYALAVVVHTAAAAI